MMNLKMKFLNNDHGFTLIELMISIIILLVIFSLIFNALAYSFQISRIQQEYYETLDDITLFIDQLSKELRQAYTITVPSHPINNDTNSNFSNSILLEFNVKDDKGVIKKYSYSSGNPNQYGLRDILLSYSISNDNGSTFIPVINNQPLTNKVFKNLIIRRPFWSYKTIEISLEASLIITRNRSLTLQRFYLISLRQ